MSLLESRREELEETRADLVSQLRSVLRSKKPWHDPHWLETLAALRENTLEINGFVYAEEAVEIDPSEPLAGRSLAEITDAAVKVTLALTRGNRSRAAEILGIGERTLYRKLEAMS